MRTACIIAGGDLPPAARVRRLAREADAVICADGGTRHAARLGIRPDVILGDMDSVSARHRRLFRGVPFIRIPEQESTDLEKALRYAVGLNFRHAVIAGVIGDRLDHSTGALGCFRKFGKKIRLTLVDRGGTLSLLGPDETITMTRGETFSLIPLGRCTGVRTDGARWPLRGETLRLGVREGISNVSEGRRIRVRHRTGILLIYRLWRVRRPSPPRHPRNR